jgi:hypothetical protein
MDTRDFFLNNAETECSTNVIKTKINTSSSTSPHGVPKHKNQHLQIRIEIMPKKEE